MAKQLIIAAMEEVFGEYILNISKENLKIAALRGKIKLENVQLDGDMIGSHVLGALGISGFGCLSCSAKLIKISIPWKKLEKEPTRFDIQGVHLVCVPLTPSTANKMYGSGTKADPRCRLRTRAKRLVLARFERNFWNGHIQGEGPPMKRISRAVEQVEQEWMKRNKRKRRISPSRMKRGEDVMEIVIDDLVQNLGDADESLPSEDTDERETLGSFTVDDLPELPRDWKTKLREKILRNLEARMSDVHIRCEVSSDDDKDNNDSSKQESEEIVQPADGRGATSTLDRSFALGFTAENIVLRTADEKWQVGSHEKRKRKSSSVMSNTHDHLGPNEYDVMNNKIGYFNNLSIYWDDTPPVLLAETDLLRGNARKVTPDKLISRVSAAMDAMCTTQEPGTAVRKSLSLDISSAQTGIIPHEYICTGFQAEIRSRSSDRTLPGPISCSADVLPFELALNILPHQYIQYQMLRSAIKSQLGFDTMLRQRPSLGPKEDPRAWWKYAVACVTSRPNSRPWEDVQRIVRHRTRYIELVTKKNARPSESTSSFSSLSDAECVELLEIEDLLPIEALLAFHLLALRRVHASRQTSTASTPPPSVRGRSRSKTRFRLLRSRSSSGTRDKGQTSETSDSDSGRKYPSSSISSLNGQISLLDAMSMRLGKKVWLVDWRLHEVSVQLILRDSQHQNPVVQLDMSTSGSTRSFGRRRRDVFFDISRCDVFHRNEKVFAVTNTVDTVFDESSDINSGLFSSLVGFPWTPCYKMGTKDAGPDMTTSAKFLELPTTGSVCRLAVARNLDSVRVSLSAHPATLVWTTSLFDGLSEFLVHPSSGPSDVTERIKNAATPLARKAQLALLSPSSSALHIMMSSPRILVPIVSHDGESVLSVDADTFLFSTHKDERQTDANWEAESKGIQMKFVRDIDTSRLYYDIMKVDSSLFDGKAVLKPFSILAISELTPSVRIDGVSNKPARRMNVDVSPVCVSLVDAEVLARSFGKWYARILGKFSTPKEVPEKFLPPLSEQGDRAGRMEHARVYQDFPSSLQLNIEKIEIAMEGHSKTHPGSFDDKTLVSNDSTLETAPSTRVYLLELVQFSLKHSRLNTTESTALSLTDCSIVRLKDESQYIPFKTRRSNVSSEDCILICTEIRDMGEDTVFDGTEEEQRKILTASFLRDKSAHLDEVEVDINALMLRVSPTTLKDCAKAFKRIAEIVQVATREMERKVHEAGRLARRRDMQATGDAVFRSESPSGRSRAMTPAFSEATAESIIGSSNGDPVLDSSILFKVTISESTLLAGRPASSLPLSSSPRRGRPRYAVIQILSNSLIMFQSNENPDGTGTKTLHVSVDNVSSRVNTSFERVSPTEASPMVGPFGAEFRIVYATENLGCVVSQDLSLNCETVKAQVTPNDFSIMANISQPLIERLRAFKGTGDAIPKETVNRKKMRPLASLVRYQKKGTGIVTRVNMEVHAISFILLRAFKSHSGAPEFLDFNIEQVKLKLEGCLSALSGDCTACLSINSFNSEVSEWEYAIEPFPFTISLDQMPNELVFHASTSRPIQMNLTGVMLKVVGEMKHDFLKELAVERNDGTLLSPSALSTVGLRRATTSRTITVANKTGLSFQVVPDSSSFSEETGLVHDGSQIVLGGASSRNAYSRNSTVCLRLATTTLPLVGEREPIFDLPVSGDSTSRRSLHLLKPSFASGSHSFDVSSGRASPETVQTGATDSGTSSFYNAEPVVEWCMHNQRLVPGIVDMFSLPKGRDLLTSRLWGCEDTMLSEKMAQAPDLEHVLQDQKRDEASSTSTTPSKEKKSSMSKRYWLRPYLKNDSPEFTDMTCTLHMARDRVMLPDSRWLWVNDWTVDLSGRLGQDTDADGWEYEADFETFTRSPRGYEKGDACRRRRWTRTRMMRPPQINDPLRELKVVWETVSDTTGNSSIVARSHLRVKNQTSIPFAVFLDCPSWDGSKFGGVCSSGSVVDVPVLLASAAYMRIAKPVSLQSPEDFENAAHTERIMILPTSQTSSNCVRTNIHLNDVSDTVLHFLIEIVSERGVVDVIVEPVFRVVNLLPCNVEFRVGQNAKESKMRSSLKSPKRSRTHEQILHTETLAIPSGQEASCLAVNPWRKPHVSVRVPGYKWSRWQRIVNRKANSSTWRPFTEEEDSYITPKADSDYAEELTMLVQFERVGSAGGDPLTLLLGVESAHCPTLRIYSQYMIVDRTGFGCRFSEGFVDILGTIPDAECSRRSYLSSDERRNVELKKDMTLPGHQWSIGMNGMSLFFSKREKLILSIETQTPSRPSESGRIRSRWISPLDVSNVMPKTVFSVDELKGQRRFELALHVSLCPGVFSRTKMIYLLPRYQIVNLLHREIVMGQTGSLSQPVTIPSQSTANFHWEKGSLSPKVRLGAPSNEERRKKEFHRCWSTGSLQLDRIGITSIRLPVTNVVSTVPMVVQVEVRLANKDQHSGVVVVIWSVNEKSSPLYMLRNHTRFSVLCRQPINEDHREASLASKETRNLQCAPAMECGTDIAPALKSLFGLGRTEEYVWVIKCGGKMAFGFDDPERMHILEWTCAGRDRGKFDSTSQCALIEVDAMGSSSLVTLPDGRRVICMIKAEHSTKVIEFIEDTAFTMSHPVSVGDELLNSLSDQAFQYENRFARDQSAEDDDEEVAFGIRLEIPSILLSVVDNADQAFHGREILLARAEKVSFDFSQTREGYHEFELKMMTFQVDNHVRKSIHPILIFCPQQHSNEPLLHMSAVRRLQGRSDTFVFRYAAIRVLEIEVYLDRRTAETVARFIEPLIDHRDEENRDRADWHSSFAGDLEKRALHPDRRAPQHIERMTRLANSGRIYFEQLHLHPVRIGFTYTQEWTEDWDFNLESTVMIFQFLRGMASIANAPLVFTSFVVGHVFEAPQTLFRVIVTHYSSQLTKQVLGILGSLAILGAPADFISNVGTGVRDFFYEPIQGAVHGPRQFIEGLEAGTQSLARGVFVGVVRGAANVTEVVNSNLAGLTADDDFIDERRAFQRTLTDAMSRGNANARSFGDSLYLAGASVARSIKSGAVGIVEQPGIYASKHGPVGFVKGVGKALVGAVVKPVVGVGDAAVLVMNHVSDVTSNKRIIPKIPIRIRRALPSRSTEKLNCVLLEPYDERAAKAQKIVTGAETLDDVYIGHVDTPSHLIIASEQCFWAIDRRSREPWCVSWEEVSHFGRHGTGLRIFVFSQTGLQTFFFQTENESQSQELTKLLSMQAHKMANSSESLTAEPESLSKRQLPGVKSRQATHIFGSFNRTRYRIPETVKDEADLVEQCHKRVKALGSDSPVFFKTLDEEAWSLVSAWGQVFSGLSSRRCIVAGVINGTGAPMQIKSSKLLEGGSPCYSIPSKEYDTEQSVLYPGGVILFFAWGVGPNLLQAGNVFMHIETKGFISELADHQSKATFAEAMPGYQVGFLEKSYDESGWWAKYWLLVRASHK